MIGFQQTSDSFPTGNRPVALIDAGLFGQKWNDVVNPLMRSFGLMVFDVFGDGVVQRCFAEEDHPVEALFLDRPDKPLGEGVQIRASGGQFDRFDARTL